MARSCSRAFAAFSRVDRNGLARGRPSNPRRGRCVGTCRREVGGKLCIVLEIGFKDADEPALEKPLLDGKHPLDAFSEIARHPVHRENIDFGVSSLMEIEKAGAFENTQSMTAITSIFFEYFGSPGMKQQMPRTLRQILAWVFGFLRSNQFMLQRA